LIPIFRVVSAMFSSTYLVRMALFFFFLPLFFLSGFFLLLWLLLLLRFWGEKVNRLSYLFLQGTAFLAGFCWMS